MFSILCLMLLVPWIKMTLLAWCFWVCVYYSRPFRSVHSHLIALYFFEHVSVSSVINKDLKHITKHITADVCINQFPASSSYGHI